MAVERESFAWSLKGQSDEERCSRMVKAAKAIGDLPSEAYRRDYDIFNVRLYENNPMVQLYDYAGAYYSETTSLALPPAEKSKNNKAKAAIDTLAAQVSTTDQRARFVVVDGKNKQRRRAREMQNFSDGLVHELKLHKLKKRAFKDAAILESGVGVLQFYRDGDRCAAGRVLATELSIDPRDGLVDGEWRTIYRQRPYPRDKAMADFAGDDVKETDRAKIRKAIEDAQPVATAGVGDYILLYEGWTLPLGKDTGDGWHCIAIDMEGGALACEPYEKLHHELVFFSVEDRFATGWGLSLMTQARDLQIGINANQYRIDRGQKLFHAGHLYVNRNARIKKSTLTNEIGTVWEGTGDTPPTKLTFQAVAPELYQQVDRDGVLIFENLGISVAASQGETNAGLNASAAAKREDTAKSDKRNADRQQRWEQFHLDCVRAALGVVRDIVTKNTNGQKRKTTGGYRVATPGQRGLSIVDWKNAALDEEDYVLQVKQASPIPTEPAGLVAFGERMLEIGEWQPGELSGYMQDLDADGRVSRKRAQERQLEKLFESLLYDKAAAAMPDEFTNLGLAMKIGVEYLAQGMEDEVAEKHLERVRRYLKRCKKMLADAEMAAAAKAQPPATTGLTQDTGGTVVPPSAGEAPGLAAVA